MPYFINKNGLSRIS